MKFKSIVISITSITIAIGVLLIASSPIFGGSGMECDLCVPIPSSSDFYCGAGTLVGWFYLDSQCEGWTSDMCKARFRFTCEYEPIGGEGDITWSENTLSIWMAGCCTSQVNEM